MSTGTVDSGRAIQAGDGASLARTDGWSVPGYTGVKALGSGGFGSVILARHDDSGTPVAIKYLKPDLLADERFTDMFRDEAAVLASMTDPHVVQLYEYVESPSGAAIVMELVDGVTLRQILKRMGGTTPEAALVVLEGSLLGLAAAHARGVVHRDYKPDNVLVNGDGVSKLTDFGIAARSGDSAAQGGTLTYAPPEQFSDAPASPAGDVYAATATFFECLTGRPPFRGDNAAALLYQHTHQPVPVDEVPEPVQPIVAAGLAKQPEDRPADAAAFVAELNQVAAQAYGPDWHERGRLHLGEAALLLTALWPSNAPPAVQGTTVAQVPLRQGGWGSGLRHASGFKKAAVASAAVAVAAAGTLLAVALTGSGHAHATIPAITGVAPPSGTTVGGNTITITGTGLADATVVSFGTVRGAISADSATQLTVVTPPATAPGAVDIYITTRFGTSHRTTADRYIYTAAQPQISGVAPADGALGGGTPVAITGTGLGGVTAVHFGGVAGTITADSSTQITVTSPPGTGIVPITVTTGAGTSRTTSAGRFTYTRHPHKTQAISFTGPGSGLAGSSAVLSATGGGSGQPVVFTVDAASGPGVCTVSGTTVTYLAMGRCVIDANQAGAGHFARAPQVQDTITVNGTAQSISFSAPAAGTVLGSGHLSATGGGSGNPVVFSVDAASGPGVCQVSGSTVTYTAGGSCVLDADQSGTGSFADAPRVRRTIAVAKLSQSISFTIPASGSVFATAPLSGKGGHSGNPVVFSIDRTSGPNVCRITGSTLHLTAAGKCVIDVNQAGNGTYAAAPQVTRAITAVEVPAGNGGTSSSGGGNGTGRGSNP